MSKKSIFTCFIWFISLIIICSCSKEDEPLAIQEIETLPDTVYTKGQNPSEIVFQIKGKNGESNNIEEVNFYKVVQNNMTIPRTPGSILIKDTVIYSSETFLKKVIEIPSNVSISINDLIENTQYFNEQDIPLRTQWNIRWEVKLKDGQIIPSQDTFKITYQCLSSLEGNYKATHDDCNMNPVNITIEKLFDSYYRDYRISDLSAGQFNCFNQDVELEFSLREECGQIIPKSDIEFGYRFSILEGSRWDETTNTLTIRWYSTIEDKIITSTFVRQ